jgi:hypothetical protein
MLSRLFGNTLFAMMPDGVPGGIPSDIPSSILPPLGEVELDSSDANDDEYDVVIDGTPEAEALATKGLDVPDSLKGKSKDEILQALIEERKKLAESQASASTEPVSALTQTMKELLGKVTPQQQPVQPGYTRLPQQPMSPEMQMSEKEFSEYISNMMIENPLKAQQLVLERQMAPLLNTFATSQAQLSRELALSSPTNKRIYDKYANEVEELVAATPVATRLQNPKIYHQAIEIVKARHVDEVVNEELEARVQALLDDKLKAMGLQPQGGTQQSVQQAQPAYVPPQTATRPASEGQKKTLVVPKWVADEADKRGLDPAFLYNHYKSKGLIR